MVFLGPNSIGSVNGPSGLGFVRYKIVKNWTITVRMCICLHNNIWSGSIAEKIGEGRQTESEAMQYSAVRNLYKP